MKLIVAFSLLGFTPVPWTVPHFGSGRSKSGKRFTFSTRTRKSRPNDMSMSLEDWQSQIRAKALSSMIDSGALVCKGPVSLTASLFERTPPGKRDGQLWFPGIKQNDKGDWVKNGRNEPDLTNLTKAIEDPLEGIVYQNDFQVRYHNNLMLYNSSPGISIVVYEIEPEDFPGIGEPVEEPTPLKKQRRKKANPCQDARVDGRTTTNEV